MSRTSPQNRFHIPRRIFRSGFLEYSFGWFIVPTTQAATTSACSCSHLSGRSWSPLIYSLVLVHLVTWILSHSAIVGQL